MFSLEVNKQETILASERDQVYTQQLKKKADHGSRVVKGMNCLRSLGRWDRRFESYSRYGCFCMRLFCVCVVLCIALRRADHSSKESCRLYVD
jgi:hypothetical protein